MELMFYLSSRIYTVNKKKLFLLFLLMVSVSAQAVKNLVLMNNNRSNYANILSLPDTCEKLSVVIDKTKFFSGEKIIGEYLNETKGIKNMIGFPDACVINGTIYVFYRFGVPHSAVKGLVNNKVYYAYLDEHGLWHTQLYLEFPLEDDYDTKGYYRDFRGVSTVEHHGDGYDAIAIGCYTPTTETTTKVYYQTFFCKLVQKADKTLTYINYELLPQVSPYDLRISAPAEDGNLTRIGSVPAGKSIINGDYLYYIIYIGHNVQVLRWRIDADDKHLIPTCNDVRQICYISNEDRKYQFSEVGAVFVDEKRLLMSVREENSHKNYNYVCDISTFDENVPNSAHVTLPIITTYGAFGPSMIIADNNILLFGRRNDLIAKSDNMVYLTKEGICIKEGISFVEHDMVVGDSMYCSEVVYNNELYVFYYYRQDTGGLFKYTLAYKTIPIEHLKYCLQ